MRNARTSYSLPLLLLLLLPLLLEDAALLSRDYLFIARTPELSMICRSGLKIGLKCSTPCASRFGLQSVMFLANRLARLLSRNFFMLAHISCARLWRSIDNDWPRYDIANSLNPFFYFPSLSILSLSVLEIHIFHQYSRDTINKIRRTNIHWHVIILNDVTCCKLISFSLNRISRFALSRIRYLIILAYDKDRCSRHLRGGPSKSILSPACRMPRHQR